MSDSTRAWSETDWAAVWKQQPREAMASKTPAQRVKSSLGPRYDSALDHFKHGGSGGKAEDKPFRTVAETFPSSEEETSTGSEPQKIEAARASSDPLLCVDLKEPEPEEGSALRYAHQATPVLSREQYVAIQHREMAKRRNDTGEKEASLPLWILLMGWVAAIFPGTYYRSLALLLRDVILSNVSALWGKITGNSNCARSSNRRSAPPPYEVIPASKYLQVIAEKRSRELQRIQE